jgi:pimeloyl-ACP methyl ester carboxylesterase
VVLVDSVEAASIHQVVDHLRAGRVGGWRFDRVVLAGHSLGSGVAILEAATYHDVDGVILTGMTHLVSALTLVKALTIHLYPVTLDPQLRKNSNDPGYLTTRPGQREPMFYETRDADPQVITTDEATKDRVPAGGRRKGCYFLRFSRSRLLECGNAAERRGTVLRPGRRAVHLRPAGVRARHGVAQERRRVPRGDPSLAARTVRYQGSTMIDEMWMSDRTGT